MKKDSLSWRTTKSLFIRRSANLVNVSPFSSRGNIFRAYQSTLKIIKLCFETTAQHSAIYYLTHLARLSPSLRSRNRLCWHTATSTHFWSSKNTTLPMETMHKTALELLDTVFTTRFEAKCKQEHALYSCVISHWLYQIYKEGGVLNRFATPRRGF